MSEMQKQNVSVEMLLEAIRDVGPYVRGISAEVFIAFISLGTISIRLYNIADFPADAFLGGLILNLLRLKTGGYFFIDYQGHFVINEI